MAQDPTPPRAVLMGDLVHSEAAPSTEALHARFNAAVGRANAAHAGQLVSPLTITLGDEFQGLARTLAASARIARGLRLDLRGSGIDCRFVIGLVEIQTPVNPDKAWNMMGPGLGRARDLLNEKKAGQFYRFSLEGHPVWEQMLDALGVGLSVIEEGWTDRQASDITALLGGDSPAELAEARGVSVHSIYKVRSSGQFDAYSAQWEAVEVALGAIDRLEGLE